MPPWAASPSGGERGSPSQISLSGFYRGFLQSSFLSNGKGSAVRGMDPGCRIFEPSLPGWDSPLPRALSFLRFRPNTGREAPVTRDRAGAVSELSCSRLQSSPSFWHLPTPLPMGSRTRARSLQRDAAVRRHAPGQHRVHLGFVDADQSLNSRAIVGRVERGAPGVPLLGGIAGEAKPGLSGIGEIAEVVPGRVHVV